MDNNNNFVYALKERIGKPEVFVGRKNELAYFNEWLSKLINERAKSTAILSRRKKGKTALVERLFNIIYNMNTNIIPFYYELKEINIWLVDFAYDFYCAFISQYLGFKLKRVDLIREKKSLDELKKIAKKEKFNKILKDIKIFNDYYEKKTQNTWEYVQSAPHRIGLSANEFIVQIIDEFQFFNKHIYWDKNKKNHANNLAGSYLSLAESKIAPLIVTGSWVGWLKTIINKLLPARFIQKDFGNLSEEEGFEAVLNYSIIEKVEVSEEVAHYLNRIVQSDPYYISAIITSQYEQKDLTTVEGLLKTIEYEVRVGDIYDTWSEYILNTIDEVNELNAKKIVLFLSKNREREWTRPEIIEKCDLPYDDNEAEKKLYKLCKGDLISEGSASNYYKGMTDNIFYKVFSYKYASEIENLPIYQIEYSKKEEDKQTIEKLKSELKSTKGLINYHKGNFFEYIMVKYLQFSNFKKENIKLKDVVENYQENAEFTNYSSVKSIIVNLEGGRHYQIDVFAESSVEGQNLYMELKNKEKPVPVSDVEKFLNAVNVLKKTKSEPIGYFIYYSYNGFTEEAKKVLFENNIMFSSSDKWQIISV